MSQSNGHKGSVVGLAAKSQADCEWTPLKVEFYKALQRCGGSGSSQEIAKASKGKIHAGHVRHFGYHGVGGGLVRVEKHEDQKGFVFILTAKGRKINLETVLTKKQNSVPKKKAVGITTSDS